MKIIVLVLIIVILSTVLVLLYKYTAFFAFYRERGEVTIVNDVPYINDGNPKHLLDIYIPKGQKGFPVVHFIHGGYWRGGDKRYHQSVTGLYGNIGVALASHGIGVVVQNYRLYPEVGIKDEINDVADAVAWTVRHIHEYGGSDNIFVMGHSAGGHLTALLASDRHYLADRDLRPTAIKGFIPMSGIFDVANMVATNDDEFNNSISYPLFGRDPKSWHYFSPLTYIHPGMQPLLILAGQYDFPYLAQQIATDVPKIQAMNPTTAYHVIPGNTHMDMVTGIGSTHDKIVPLILDFIQKYK